MIFWHVGLTMVVVWFVMRDRVAVDYRVVAIASLLPDIIDKPLGLIVLRRNFESGRIYGHTLILNVALFGLLFLLRGDLKRKFVLVPIASILHLIEDGVFSNASVILWPLYGTSFPNYYFRYTGGFWSHASLLRNPALVWQECVGFALLVLLFGANGALGRSGIRSFFRTGTIGSGEPATDEATVKGRR